MSLIHLSHLSKIQYVRKKNLEAKLRSVAIGTIGFVR
jgi:hypothetical protein